MNDGEKKWKTIVVSYSKKNVISVKIMATERQTVGETSIKITTETTIRLQEIPASMGNAKTSEREATRLLNVWKRNVKRKNISSTTSLWDTHYVEKCKKRTTKNISNNG